jgi:L-ascorbate metabolism protein UlaG (beta-lactamase superfamily)
MSKLTLGGARLERIQASPQRRDGRFVNPSGRGPELQGDALPLLGEFFFGGAQRRPPGPLPMESPLSRWARAPETGLRVTWLGHSTMLVEIDGMRVLTDPVFGERASPTSLAGPRRFHPVPIAFDAIEHVDVVLLSHDHYDHLCRTTMRAIGKRGVPVVTALGVGARLECFGVASDTITELDWHEHVDVGGLRLTATPSQHFSGRGLTDRNATLWASWVLQTDRHRVFFSGDTGLFPEMADIGRRYGPFDLTMLEIGAYHPSWGDIHLGPENALRAHVMLGGARMMPVHWGTFDLALHAWDEPAETLVSTARTMGVDLFMTRLGSPAEPTRTESIDPWWREVVAAQQACAILGR